MSYRYNFTVFTPSYNRARTLPRVYESLLAQTSQCAGQFLRADEAEGDEVAVERRYRSQGRGWLTVTLNDDLAALRQVDFQGVQRHGDDLVETIREAVEVVFAKV